MGGTPDYGLTGGGLLIYDTSTAASTVLPDTQMIVNQSTAAMAPLAGSKMIGGTTVAPGTGGVQKATVAELYIFNLTTKAVEWHSAIIPGVLTYTQLYAAANGLIYGIADNKTFFTFNPTTKTIVHTQNLLTSLSAAPFSQGPKLFVDAPDGSTYVLLTNGIARLNYSTNDLVMAATSPSPIEVGGDYLNGRIYFVSNAHVMSWLVDSTSPTLASSNFYYDGGTLPDDPQRLMLRFSEDVGASLHAVDIQVTNVATNVTATLVDSDIYWSPPTNIALVSFTQLPGKQLPDGNYHVTLSKTGITDAFNNPLTGNATADFFVLSGDANHDRKINMLDFNVLAANFGGSGKIFSKGDFDYSGTVNSIDFGILQSKWGTSLAPPATGAVVNAAPVAALFRTGSGTERDDPLGEINA